MNGVDASCWTALERHRSFVTWATEPVVTPFGARVRYAVMRDLYLGNGHGYYWARAVLVVPLSGDLPDISRRSRGEFYDGNPAHPEGGIEWCKAWASLASRGTVHA